MIKLSRLKKLEIAANENRRQKRQRPTIDYSLLTDDELNSLYNREIEKINSEPSPYAGMTEQELSDLYMQQIQEGNRKNLK